MSLTFDYPSRQADLAAVRSFLYSLVERLNVAFGSLENDVGVAARQAVAQSLSEGGGENKATQSLRAEYQAIKALILKTAHTVESEIQRVEQTLTSSTVAASDFGDYRQSIEANIVAQADSITQVIRYYEQINTSVASFDEYVTRTEGYISSGIVDWDGSVPLFGIAIGQNLQKDVVTVDGEEYDFIRKADFRTVITSMELAFWRDDVKVAYMSSCSDRLYIPNAEITDSLTIGGWEITPTQGLTLKWTG